eukprot:TRINITY_DN254_c0_g1_i9.p3 TRINITY_DN254_c0_g1~~TRINITY_DN254_c0_g1_i9.p3  ORF type:complete len:112 (-),score=26.03 TRINITY_DN254_c0_g1_i9:27-362(-)
MGYKMESIKAAFDKAAELVRAHVKDIEKLKDEQRLEIYGLFKQATVGDVNTPEPGMFKMTEKAKWGAWKKNQGMSKEDAMTKYVEVAKSYLPADAAAKLQQDPQYTIKRHK